MSERESPRKLLRCVGVRRKRSILVWSQKVKGRRSKSKFCPPTLVFAH